ncbi:MAG: Npt1/Npt2 family nucleotide transporter [Vicinamibacteria bacterium]
MASESRVHLVAPLTAAALIAQQVGSNAIRDGLFLSWFPVTSLPYFIAGSALLAIPSAQSSGRLLTRFGPARVVPAVLGLSGLFFFAEWALLGWQPRAASVLLYLHSSVLGAIAISAFWSLLNERFDPHSAKPLMAKVAAAATFGGLVGGVGAERVAALLPQGALLLFLGLAGAACTIGALAVGRGMPVRHPAAKAPESAGSGWTEIRRTPLLRDLALVIALAAALAALVDYVLKAEAVAYFGKGEPLVRFFGLFYAGTGVAAFLLQATLGRVVLSRLGLGGSVATHPVVVGAAGLIGFIAPAPWRGILPRGLDVGVRNSVFRAGYELLYTPLPEATKRSAKSIIDVAWDCLGKSGGAAVILLLTRLAPLVSVAAVNVAGVLVAAGELFVARRLKAGYVRALEGGLRSQGDIEAAQYSLSDFTMAESLAGLDRTALLRAMGQGAERTQAASDDPVLAAIADLRSGDLTRIRAALSQPLRDRLLIGALIPLLARREVLRPVGTALAAFGARGAGQLVDALLDPATPEVVRRRLPLALKSCPSVIALEGLVQALSAPSFELRLRSGRALLALTDDHPELSAHLHPETALAAVERELADSTGGQATLEHVFNLLALALEREPARITARAFDTDDPYVRGTALEYLETVLTPALFGALQPRLAAPGGPAPRKRATAEAREDLLRAGATMAKISLEDVRRELAAADPDEEG